MAIPDRRLMAESPQGREALRQEALEGARRLVAVNPERAQAEAIRVFHLARQEKRAAQRHKRRCQEKMILFNEFKRNLESLGINVVIEPPINSPKPGGSSDNGQQEGL